MPYFDDTPGMFSFQARAASRVPSTLEEDDPVPEDGPGMLSRVLGGLGYVGSTLDKPGAAIRGLLAGRPKELAHLIPFSDAMGITDYGGENGGEEAESGRSLLEKAGLVGKNKPGLFNDVGDFLGDVAGFGVELATDPLTWVGPGVLGKAGLKAKALFGPAGRAQFKTAQEGLTAALKKADEAKKIYDSTQDLLVAAKATGKPTEVVDSLAKQAAQNNAVHESALAEAKNWKGAVDEGLEPLAPRWSDQIRKGQSSAIDVGTGSFPFNLITPKELHHIPYGTGEAAAKLVQKYYDEPLEALNASWAGRHAHGIFNHLVGGQILKPAQDLNKEKVVKIQSGSRAELENSANVMRQSESFEDPIVSATKPTVKATAPSGIDPVAFASWAAGESGTLAQRRAAQAAVDALLKERGIRAIPVDAASDFYREAAQRMGDEGISGKASSIPLRDPTGDYKSVADISPDLEETNKFVPLAESPLADILTNRPRTLNHGGSSESELLRTMDESPAEFGSEMFGKTVASPANLETPSIPDKTVIRQAGTGEGPREILLRNGASLKTAANDIDPFDEPFKNLSIDPDATARNITEDRNLRGLASAIPTQDMTPEKLAALTGDKAAGDIALWIGKALNNAGADRIPGGWDLGNLDHKALLGQLVTAIHEAPAAIKGQLESIALRIPGLSRIGTPGEAVEFAGRHHVSGSPMFPGDKAIVETPGWVRRDATGGEVLLKKADVKPGSASAMPAEGSMFKSRLPASTIDKLVIPKSVPEGIAHQMLQTMEEAGTYRGKEHQIVNDTLGVMAPIFETFAKMNGHNPADYWKTVRSRHMTEAALRTGNWATGVAKDEHLLGMMHAVNGRRIVTATEKAQGSTLLHELTHVADDLMPESEKALVRKFSGGDDEWLPRHLERFVATGKAPTPELQTIFQRLSTAISEVVARIRDYFAGTERLTPEMEQMFSRWMQPGKVGAVVSEAPATVDRALAYASKLPPQSDVEGLMGVARNISENAGEKVAKHAVAKALKEVGISPEAIQKIIGKAGPEIARDKLVARISKVATMASGRLDRAAEAAKAAAEESATPATKALAEMEKQAGYADRMTPETLTKAQKGIGRTKLAAANRTGAEVADQVLSDTVTGNLSHLTDEQIGRLKRSAELGGPKAMEAEYHSMLDEVGQAVSPEHHIGEKITAKTVKLGQHEDKLAATDLSPEQIAVDAAGPGRVPVDAYWQRAYEHLMAKAPGSGSVVEKVAEVARPAIPEAFESSEAGNQFFKANRKNLTPEESDQVMAAIRKAENVEVQAANRAKAPEVPENVDELPVRAEPEVAKEAPAQAVETPAPRVEPEPIKTEVPAEPVRRADVLKPQLSADQVAAFEKAGSPGLLARVSAYKEANKIRRPLNNDEIKALKQEGAAAWEAGGKPGAVQVMPTAPVAPVQAATKTATQAEKQAEFLKNYVPPIDAGKPVPPKKATASPVAAAASSPVDTTPVPLSKPKGKPAGKAKIAKTINQAAKQAAKVPKTEAEAIADAVPPPPPPPKKPKTAKGGSGGGGKPEPEFENWDSREGRERIKRMLAEKVDVPQAAIDKAYKGRSGELIDMMKSLVERVDIAHERKKALGIISSNSDLRDAFIEHGVGRFSQGAYVAKSSKFKDFVDHVLIKLGLVRPQWVQGKKAANLSAPIEKGRKEWLTNWSKGSVGINDAVKKFAGEEVSDGMKAYLEKAKPRLPDETPELWQARIEEAANKISKLPDGMKETGLYDRAAIDDAHTVMQYAVRQMAAGEAAHRLIATTATAAPAGHKIEDAFKAIFPYGDVDRGLTTMLKENGDALGKIGVHSLEGMKKLYVPEAVVDAANRFDVMQKGAKAWHEIDPIIKAYDVMTDVIKKTLTVPFPAFHARNFTSGMFVNALSGAFSLASIQRAWKLWQGKDLSALDHGMLDELRIHGVSDTVKGFRGIGDSALPSVESQLFDLRKHMNMETGGLKGEFKRQEAGLAESYGEAKTKPGQVIRKAQAAGQSLSAMVEFINRSSHYMALRDKGWSPHAAAQSTETAHHSYGNLTRVEKHLLQRLIPFYSFARFNMPYQLEQLAKTRGPLPKIIRATLAAREDAEIPDYLGSGTVIPVNAGDDKNMRYITGLGLPYEEAFERFKLGPGGGIGKTADAHLGMFHPLLKAPLEAVAGRQFFSGRNLEDLGGKLTGDPYLDNFVYNAPGSRALTTGRQLLDDRKGPAVKGLNLLTGLKISDVDAEKAANIRRKNELIEALKASPNIKKSSFQNFSAKPGAELSDEEASILAAYRATTKKK